MKSIAVTKPDMGVLSRERLPLSPFGALAQAFAEELLVRAEWEEGRWPFVPLELLEEGEAASPPAAAPVEVTFQVDLRLVLEALRRENVHTEGQRVTERLVERIIRIQKQQQAAPRPKRSLSAQSRPQSPAVWGMADRNFLQKITQRATTQNNLTMPSAVHGQRYPGELARQTEAFFRQLQLLRAEGKAFSREMDGAASMKKRDTFPAENGIPRTASPAAPQKGEAPGPRQEPLTLLENQEGASQTASDRTAALWQAGDQVRHMAERILGESTALSSREFFSPREANRSDQPQGHFEQAQQSGEKLSEDRRVLPSAEGLASPMSWPAAEGGVSHEAKTLPSPGADQPPLELAHRTEPGERESIGLQPREVPPTAREIFPSARNIRVSPELHRPTGETGAISAPEQQLKERTLQTEAAFSAERLTSSGEKAIPSVEQAASSGAQVPSSREQRSFPGAQMQLSMAQTIRSAEGLPLPLEEQTQLPKEQARFSAEAVQPPLELAYRTEPGEPDSIGPQSKEIFPLARDIRVSPEPHRATGETGVLSAPEQQHKERTLQAGTAFSSEQIIFFGEKTMPPVEQTAPSGERVPPSREQRSFPGPQMQPSMAQMVRSADGLPLPSAEQVQLPGEQARFSAGAGQPPLELAYRTEPGEEESVGSHSWEAPPAAREISPPARDIRVSPEFHRPIGEPKTISAPGQQLKGSTLQTETTFPAERLTFSGEKVVPSVEQTAPSGAQVPSSGEQRSFPGAQMQPSIAQTIRSADGLLLPSAEQGQLPGEQTRSSAGTGQLPLELAHRTEPEGWAASAYTEGSQNGEAVAPATAESRDRMQAVQSRKEDGQRRFTKPWSGAARLLHLNLAKEQSEIIFDGRTIHTAARNIQSQTGKFPDRRPVPGKRGSFGSAAVQMGGREAYQKLTEGPAGTLPFAELALNQQSGGEQANTPAAVLDSAPESGKVVGGKKPRELVQPKPVPLTYGPIQTAAGPNSSGQAAEDTHSQPEESDYVRSLPEWARTFLKNGGGDSHAPQTMGVARDIAVSQPENGGMVQWTAPRYHPPETPMAYREKERKDPTWENRPVRISDVEIQRTADRVYRIIEERIRRERRRLGL